MFIALFIIILMCLVLLYFSFILILKDDTNNDHNYQLKWLKEAFNGEQDEIQLFFINKDDVTDVKLLYELLSAKKAVETNNINENYNLLSFDPQDKYCEYQIMPNNKLEVYDNTGYNFELYDKLLDKKYKIEKLQEKFMKESNFNNEEDLVAYYKAIIAAKKIDKEEVKKIADTYFKMINQLDRLKSINRNEIVNDAIDKIHATQGFGQSQLRRELDELIED